MKALRWIFGVSFVLMAGLMAYMANGSLQDHVADLLQWSRNHKVAGASILIGLYQVFPFLLLPITTLTLASGFLYGAITGFVIVSVAVTLSCAITFFVGRTLLMKWVHEKEETNSKIKAVNDAIESGGWRVVALSRFSIFLPFAFLNFTYGGSRISFRNYIITSCIAMMPGTLLYVYLGTTLEEIRSVWDPSQHTDTMRLIVLGIVIASTIALMGYLTWKSKKLLKEYEINAQEQTND